jgi:hypothetical protein
MDYHMLDYRLYSIFYINFGEYLAKAKQGEG